MAPDSANIGLARPPVIYLGSIALGVVLHFAWPEPLIPVPSAISTAAGVVGTLAAVALFVYAVRTFKAAGTPVPGNLPTIVRAGPYRFSRNPIYLAFSLLQLAIAAWVNSPWLVLTLVAAVAVMSLVVIPREERYLEGRFPEYSSYKASVRRWL
jgi:protein-S-isoprenylcysteine O-methyltransferase Ste14